MTRRFCAHPALISLTALAFTGCAQPSDPPQQATVEATINTLPVTNEGTLLWNKRVVSIEELAGLLEETKRLPTEPELRFEPAMSAPYEVSAAVLKVIKESGVSKFGFVGNEKYRVRDADGN